jgi:hypothetical protein
MHPIFSSQGMEYNFVDLSEATLRDVHLPAFKATLDAGALTLMSAFNDIAGVPATGNRSSGWMKLKPEKMGVKWENMETPCGNAAETKINDDLFIEGWKFRFYSRLVT